MSEFEQYLKPGEVGHLVGIGGVSMSPLAEVLSDAGLIISGSDIAESERTSHLREKGIEISIGHDAANITNNIDFVVRTAAAHDDNPEIVRAHEMGIPVFERTQAWGAIMKGYKNALCISGTHGKNDNDLDVHAYPHGGRKGPDSHDRRHSAAFEGRAQGRCGRYDSHGVV